MSPQTLGEFEQMVLLAVLRLKDEAYGVAIREQLEEVAGRSTSSGALYTTLDRLEKKGLLESRPEEGDTARGGRPRRYVEVTPDGLALLAQTRSTLLALWDGVEGALEG